MTYQNRYAIEESSRLWPVTAAKMAYQNWYVILNHLSPLRMGALGARGRAMAEDLPPRLRKPRLRRQEASEYLRIVHGVEIAPATLAKYVSIGGGPPFSRLNRTPLYAVGDLDAWVASKLRPAA
jgi:hypothetical protein